MRFTTALLRSRPYKLLPTESGLFPNAEAKLQDMEKKIQNFMADFTHISRYDSYRKLATEQAQLAGVIVSGMRDDHLAALSVETRVRLLEACGDSSAEYDVRKSNAQTIQRLLDLLPLSDAYINQHVSDVQSLVQAVKTQAILVRDHANWGQLDGFEKVEALNRLFKCYGEISGKVCAEIYAFAEAKDKDGYVKKLDYSASKIGVNVHPDAPFGRYTTAAIAVFEKQIGLLNSGYHASVWSLLHGEKPPKLSLDERILRASDSAPYLSGAAGRRPDIVLDKRLTAEFKRGIAPGILQTLADGLTNFAVTATRTAPKR